MADRRLWRLTLFVVIAANLRPCKSGEYNTNIILSEDFYLLIYVTFHNIMAHDISISTSSESKLLIKKNFFLIETRLKIKNCIWFDFYIEMIVQI